MAVAKKARHLGGMGNVIHIACLALWFLVTPKPAHGGDQFRPSEKQAASPPESWVEVDSSQRVPILEMLASQTKGNYEKIKTWRGRYSVHVRTHVGATEAAATLGPHLKKRVDSGYINDLRHTLDFAIDVRADAIYRWKNPIEYKWIEEASHQVVEVPNVRSPNQRSVVTPEQYLHFDPNETYGEFQALPDHPEAQDRRAAFRDDPSNVDRKHHGELLNPRMFYRIDPLSNFWDLLGFFAGALKGEHGERMQTVMAGRLHVYQASSPAGPWYRVQQVYEASAGGDTSILSIICSPTASFNPVHKSFDVGSARQTRVIATQWRWQLSGNIHVPGMVREMHYKPDGTLRYERESVLENSVVNEPMDPSQFSYAGLGMQDGDLVMDRIEGIAYVLDGGKPKKLADFNTEYLPTRGKVRVWLRRALIGLGVVAVLAVAIFLAVKFRRKAAT